MNLNGQIARSLQHQQPMLQVASPLNDTQLVALIAAQRTDVTEAEAVEWAITIVLESITQTSTLQQRLAARVRPVGQ